MNMEEKTNTFSNLTDCHMHTAFSLDAEEKTEAMMERAAELGLAACCITDHCEMNSADLNELKQDMTASVNTVEQLRIGAFSNKSTRFLTGLELGQATQNPAEAERFLREIPVDFVLGSLHNLAGEEDFYYLSYTPESAEQYLQRYWKELLELVQWGDFDSLSHLTYPLRYICGKYHIQVDMKRYQEDIDAVLSKLAKKGKALEVNTSGLRGGLAETMPGLSYIKRFRELGGQYITLGSDAHFAKDVGKGLCEAAKLVKSAGFPGIVYYHKRNPVLIAF